MSASTPLAPHERSSLERPLSVSQLMGRLNRLLELKVPSFWVEGEVTDFKAMRSGHWYFALKDEQSRIQCVMFRGRNQLLPRPLREGDLVRASAKAGIYEPRGQLQVVVEGIELSGDGALLAALEALKQKLAAEGVFDPARRRPLPPCPQVIGVVTSAQAAALRDIVHVLARRWPLAEVRVFPTLVQGEEAPAALRRALALAQREESGRSCDVLILARGGGSLADLQAFNDELLARMVAACRIPIVTGVGHETDTTLVDYAADLRAPTPSAAAEAVSPSRDEYLGRLHHLAGRLQQAVARGLQQRIQRLDELSRRLGDPLERQGPQQQRLQQLMQRLRSAGQRSLSVEQQRLMQLQQRLDAAHPVRYLQQAEQQLMGLQARLWRHSPERQVQQGQVALTQLSRRLSRVITQRCDQYQMQLAHLGQRLHLVSPLATLGRGYALVQDEQQRIVKMADAVNVGDRLTVRLAEGNLGCRVEETWEPLDDEYEAFPQS